MAVPEPRSRGDGQPDLDIPAESIVHFKLAEDLVVQPAQ